MTPFDPKWPNGHVTRDGRKATVHCVLEDGTIVASVEGKIGGVWGSDGRLHDGEDSRLDLLNAPAPKRTWEVVAVEWLDVSVVFRPYPVKLHSGEKIVGRCTLTEGEGMEEKDG